MTMEWVVLFLLSACTLMLPSGGQDPAENLPPDGTPPQDDLSDAPVCAEGWRSLAFSSYGGWYGRQTFCFKKLQKNMGWKEAQGECWAQYSHLLLLTSNLMEVASNAVQQIGDLLQNMDCVNEPFWIGMHMDHSKLWWDGKTVTSVDRNPYSWHWSGKWPVSDNMNYMAGRAVFTKIKAQTPPGPEDPVTFLRKRRQVQDSDQYTYNVNVSLIHGERKLPVVCMNTGFSPMLQKDEKLCGPGWFGSVYVDMCLWFNGSLKLNHSEAESHCQGMGGHLVVMSSNYTTTIVIKFMKNKPLEEVWLGFTKSGSTFSWVNGKKWESDNSVMRTPKKSGCGSFAINRPTDRPWWFVQDCAQKISFLCQKSPRKLDSPKITEQPEPLTLPVSNFDPSESEVNTQPAKKLTCTVQHYYPHFPIVWVKDGYHLPAKHPHVSTEGVSPLAVDFNLLNQIGGTTGDLQGYYWCETVAASTKTRYVSQKALVKFDGLLTFVGRMRSEGSVITYADIAPENYFVKPSYEVVSKPEIMLHDLIQETQRLIPGLKLTAKIERYRQGSVIIEYRLYARINEKVFLPPDVDVDREEQVREIVQTELNNVVTNKSSAWNSKHQNWNINSSSVTLTGVESCPVIALVHPPSERTVRLMSTPVGGFGESIPCLSDGIPLVTARCQGDYINGASWVDIKYHTGCDEMKGSAVTASLIKLSELRISLNNAENVSEEMFKLTQDPDILTMPDIVYTSHIMSNIVRVRNLKVTLGDTFVGTLSSLLKSDINAISRAQTINQASKRMITSLDQFAASADLNKLKSKRFIKPNVAVEIHEVDNNTSPVLGFQSSSTENVQEEGFSKKSINNLYGRNELQYNQVEAAILFPSEVFSWENFLKDAGPDADTLSTAQRKTRVSFTVYQDDGLFQTPARLNRSSVYQAANSRVISGSIAGRKIRNLKTPVQTVFLPLKDISTEQKVRCVFWDFEADKGIGDWSSEGCWYNGTQNGRHVCSCNHLTNFAILIDMYDDPVDPTIKAALSWISIIGLSLSIFGLLATVITFIIFSKFRKNRSQKTMLNLAVALLCSMVVFIAGIERTENYYGCLVVAMLLHYFILVSFMWMLIEAILNYMRFVKVMGTYIPKFMLKTMIPAWSIPLVPVIIVASIDYTLYRGREEFCWMALTPLYYAFLLPIGAIIVTNTVLYILVIKGMTCDRGKGLKTNQSKSRLAWMQVNAAISCFVVLGLTWIFGFLAIEDARIVFQFLFCIFNSIQGFLIFIFHIARSDQVRNAWVQLCCRKDVQEKYLAPSVAVSESNSNKATVSTTATSSQSDTPNAK